MKKHDEVGRLKKELNEALNEREDYEKRNLRRRKQNKNVIKNMEENLKNIVEGVQLKNQGSARFMKISQIKDEV